MVRVEVDFAYNEELRPVLFNIRRHRGWIIDFDPSGPAGGNPCLLLEFDEEQDALAFLAHRYPDDSEEFNRSRIKEIDNRRAADLG